MEPTARATPPPPVRGERRGYAHRACCSGSAPTLSPFRWLDVVLSLPSHQVTKCGEIGGGRYVAVGLLLGRAAANWLLVLWPRRGGLAGRVREGAVAAVKADPGCVSSD